MTETPRDDKPKPARRPRIKLPFDNRREDVGSWTYDHRIGLCVTLIAYLALKALVAGGAWLLWRYMLTLKWEKLPARDLDTPQA